MHWMTVMLIYGARSTGFQHAETLAGMTPSRVTVMPDVGLALLILTKIQSSSGILIYGAR